MHGFLEALLNIEPGKLLLPCQGYFTSTSDPGMVKSLLCIVPLTRRVGTQLIEEIFRKSRGRLNGG